MRYFLVDCSLLTGYKCDFLVVVRESVCVIMSERMTLWLHPRCVLCVCVFEGIFYKKKTGSQTTKKVVWFGCVENFRDAFFSSGGVSSK